MGIICAPQTASVQNPIFGLHERRACRPAILLGAGECFGALFEMLLMALCVSVTPFLEALWLAGFLHLNCEPSQVAGEPCLRLTYLTRLLYPYPGMMRTPRKT